MITTAMKELSNLIEESAAKLFESFADSDAGEQMEAGIFPSKQWAEFLNDGWLQTVLSEENDGAGLGLAGGCVLMRLAGYYNVALPVVESLMAAFLIAESGLETSDELLIPVMLNAENINDGIVKVYGAPWARHAAGIVFVQEHKGSCVISKVALDALIISQGENMAGEPRDDIRLSEEHLAQAKPIAGLSLKQLTSWMALARSAQISGALQKTLEMTVNYANERKQFGRQIGKFQAVQQQLAVQAELSSAAACAVDAAIVHLNTEQEWECIAGAKITSGEAAGVAGTTAHAVHAAIGFTKEYSLQLSTRRLWSWRDEYGNEGQWSIALGEHFLGRNSENLWNDLTQQTA